MSTRFVIPLLAAAVALAGCAQTEESTPETGDAAGESEAMAEAGGENEARRMAAEKGIESGQGGQWSFGGEMGQGEMVTVAALNDHPEQYAGKVVRIEGTIASVCKNMGCWVEVAGGEGEKIMVASDDHDVLVPRNGEGKPITVEGRFEKQTPDEGGETTYSLSLDAATVSAGAS